MASIKNLEMAEALSQHQHIAIKKSLFSTKAVYTPTQSTLDITTQEYTPADGERMEHLLSLPLPKLEAELQAKGKPATTPVGHFRLEAAVAKDRQFAAVQLFRFVDFEYKPASELCIAEGTEAESLIKLL